MQYQNVENTKEVCGLKKQVVDRKAAVADIRKIEGDIKAMEEKNDSFKLVTNLDG